MKNSSQTQHHRSKTKKKEEQKIEEIAGCKLEAGSNRTVVAGRMEQCVNSDFCNGSENSLS